MSETTAHIALAQFLKCAAGQLPALSFVWHTANESAGGPKAANGIPLDVLREARMGSVSGVWDWLVIGGNHHRIDGQGAYFFLGLAVELKSTKAYRSKDQGLSDAQKAWRSHYMRHGWYTAIYPEDRWHEAAQLFVKWVGGDVNDFRF